MKPITFLLYCFFLFALIGCSPNIVEERQWSSYRGYYSSGVLDNTTLPSQWDVQRGTNIKWKIDIPGLALSCPVIWGDKLFITSAISQTDNALLRACSYVNSNPVDDESVHDWVVYCLDNNTGDIIWEKTAFTGVPQVKRHPKSTHANCTPATDGEHIVAFFGSEGLYCYDMTGELIWKSKSRGAHRSNMSPIAIEHCGKQYIITSVQTHMLGVDVENGDILWSYHYIFLDKNGDNATIFTNSPIYQDSCLWISNGWDVKSVMLEIAPDGKSVSEKFSDHTFDNQNHGVVLIDGFLYGSNFTGRQSGKWVCMNWNTGEIVWIEDFHNKGPILSSDGMLYCYEEKRGNMALAKADRKEFKVISSFKVKEGKGPHWARPAIYHGMLLVRHGDFLQAFNIK